jgi:transcriptional regulator with XRE-family HTH domain
MLFKEKLVILRKSRSLTQDEFASAVGVSRQAVYKWESGQSYPEVPKLLEMKSLLGISIDELLDDSFDIPLPEKKKRRRRKKAAEAATETVATEVKEEKPSVVEEPAVIEEVKVEEPVAVKEEVKVEEPVAVEPVEEEEVVVEDNDNGFEVEDAPDINMPGHVAMPKFVDVNIPTKKNTSNEEKRGSFFAKFFSKK